MNDKAKHAGRQKWGDGSRLVAAALIPLVAFAVQWFFWADIQPYVWFLFFPAVFFSSWVGGLRGGLLATTESTLLVWYCFIPPSFSFALEPPMALISIVVFVGMGILFSIVHERLRKAKHLGVAEAALRASEQRLRFVTENAQVGLVVVNREHRYRYANAAYGQVLGLETTDIIGRRVADILGGLYEQQVKPRLERAFAGERVTYELLKPVSGVNRYYAVTYEPHQMLDGQAEAVVVVIFDITERKQVEASVAEAARLAQSTIDALSAHICLLDETGKILTTNEAWRRFARENHSTKLLPATRDNNYLEVCDAVVGPEAAEAAAFAAGIRSVLAGTAAEFAMEYPCHSPTEQRWFVGRVTRFGNHDFVRVVVAHENISDRKRSEELLLDSQALYHSLVEHLPAGVFRKDTAGRYTFVNSMFCRLKGLQAEEIIGKTPVEVSLYEEATLAPGSSAATMKRQRTLAVQGTDDHERIMSTGESLSGEEFYSHPDGTTEYFQTLKGPVYNADGKLIGTQGIQFDVTQRKQAEEALRASDEKFQQLADNITDAFWIRSPDLSAVHYVSPAFERIWGRPVASVYAHPESWAEWILPADRGGCWPPSRR